jgi:taurine dioxygenase
MMTVRPLTTAVGAEIDGLDLSRPLRDDEVDLVTGALDRHLVVFFRDQDLTEIDQLAFARRFGTISVAPFGPKHPDHPEITVLDQTAPAGQGADNWHADNTFQPAPPLGSILRAVQLPRVGGDTCFASMVAAYEALSAQFKVLLEGMTAVHDITRMLRLALANGQATEGLEAMQRAYPPHEHPVVRTDPATGRRALFVNGNWTSRLVGLTARENDAVLGFLLDHVRAPEFQCRFRWTPGSVAFWDNRWAQHYGVADYAGERRIMHRITLDGDVPV